MWHNYLAPNVERERFGEVVVSVALDVPRYRASIFLTTYDRMVQATCQAYFHK